jgi:hypothetical protein
VEFYPDPSFGVLPSLCGAAFGSRTGIETLSFPLFERRSTTSLSTTITVQPFGLAAVLRFNAAKIISRNSNNLLNQSRQYHVVEQSVDCQLRLLNLHETSFRRDDAL